MMRRRKAIYVANIKGLALVKRGMNRPLNSNHTNEHRIAFLCAGSGAELSSDD